ncbi:rhodanese-like domain-containing protein [Pseudonocardia acaciae]|uniref:rhodanese-like domain-containing protein n=1 Tax=Pseudonocardia acaciae TaxID=551276 RepID=UPI00055DDF90|nr:rhodanese-like domain-containing protein [Pseudonocardia acaciae]
MTRQPPILDTEDLRARLASASPPTLLDVRTPSEFAAVHIPGSYNVPLATLREHRDELTRTLDAQVVLICQTGPRAEQAEKALADAGLPGVHVLAGGIRAWQAAGAPTNRGRNRWDLERQVRFTAGALVLAGLLGNLVVPGLEWLSAGVGAGLVLAAVTNTCAMGNLLSRLPWNRTGESCPTLAITQLAKDR